MAGFPSVPSKFASSDDEFVDSDDVSNSRLHTHSTAQNSKLVIVPGGNIKREFRRRNTPHGWLHRMVLINS